MISRQRNVLLSALLRNAVVTVGNWPLKGMRHRFIDNLEAFQFGVCPHPVTRPPTLQKGLIKIEFLDLDGQAPV